MLAKYAGLTLSFLLTAAPAFVVAYRAGWNDVAVVGLLASLFGTFSIYMAPNLPEQQYVKPLIAWGLALFLALQQVVGSGGLAALTPEQIVMVVTAAFSAIGLTAFQASEAGRQATAELRR